ncbi:hypothetical protein [Pedobacter sp.]
MNNAYHKVIIAFYFFALMLTCTSPSLAQANEYSKVKEKILKGSKASPTALTETEKKLVINELSRKLKNDKDFALSTKHLNNILLSRLDSTRTKAKSSRESLVMAMRGVALKFPELSKLDKETRKSVMKKAGDTLTSDQKKLLMEAMLKKLKEKRKKAE